MTAADEQPIASHPEGRREHWNVNQRTLKTCAVVGVLLFALGLIATGLIPSGLGSAMNIPGYLFHTKTLSTHRAPDGKGVVKIVENTKATRDKDRIPVYIVYDEGRRPKILGKDDLNATRQEPNVVWRSNTTFDVMVAIPYSNAVVNRRFTVKK